jgi:hypothetical protein
MPTELKIANIETPTVPIRYPMRRIRLGLTLTLIGFLVFLIGARPDVFGLDRSPVIGFVQIAVFIVGLAIVLMGGYISLMALWKGRPISIAADIGQRLVATGFVVAVFAGMADVFGLGSHIYPMTPYFGIWQQIGVMFAQTLMALGFLLMIPWTQAHKRASIESDTGRGKSPIASNIS